MNIKKTIKIMLGKLEKTDKQFVMAMIWSAAIIYWITYILMKFASGDKGILNLLIGFMTGTSATILGVYFVTQMNKKTDPQGPGTMNADISLTATTSDNDSTKTTQP